MNVFSCEIQARLRDINLAGHVDNVEALRVVDEARLLFLRFAELPGLTPPASADGVPGPRGLLAGVPVHVMELMGGQRVEYRTEMRFVAYQPFLLRLWITRVGTSSFTVAADLRTDADAAPALVAEMTMVLFDGSAQRPWALRDEVRAALEAYAGEPVTFRG